MSPTSPPPPINYLSNVNSPLSLVNCPLSIKFSIVNSKNTPRPHPLPIEQLKNVLAGGQLPQ
ncbi:MAG: hypothetical protein EA409_08680 [Saprospirales bacterium]|nr:MAG: hypothetical protein EA409_08680 [Saprospirales bacterium]